jgi:hypothetical protein
MKKLLGSLLVACTLFAAPVLAEDAAPGTRVTVTSGSELPDPEALVKALEQPGGRHEVRVRVKHEGDQRTLTLELWGNSVAADQVEATLRDKFPPLASAQISVEAINEPAPAIDENEAPKKGHRVIIKKEIRETDDAGQ